MSVTLEGKPAASSVQFGLVEVDLLATHAGVPVPFPLRVPSFGRIPGERDVLLDAAGYALRLRGLADDTGPVGVAAELVDGLREYRAAVDLVAVTEERALGVVALVYRSTALICEQDLDPGETATIRVRQVADTALAATLAPLLPAVAPARSMPVMVPAHVVDTARQLVASAANDRELQQRLRDLMRDYGGDPDALDQLAKLLATPTGRGQLGVTRRTAGGVERAGAELSWLDGPHGRVRVYRGADGWVSVNPLRPAAVRFALDDLAMIAREQR